jgi:hypothetical protein
MLVFLLSSQFLFCACLQNSEVSLVFVHIGKKLPTYLETAISQARLFNDCNIVLIANEILLDENSTILTKYDVIGIACEAIQKTENHLTFQKTSTLDKNFRDGFVCYTTERFFYIDDIIQQYNMKNVIHLENDNMLYVDLKELLPIFSVHYPYLGTTFDADDRCIAAFVYFRDSQISSLLTDYLISSTGSNDMISLALFRKNIGNEIAKNLPIIHNSYQNFYPIGSLNPSEFSILVDKFQSIFDAAYLGQYLGGQDPRNGPCKKGFVNEHCAINASFLSFKWEYDNKNRYL